MPPRRQPRSKPATQTANSRTPTFTETLARIQHSAIVKATQIRIAQQHAQQKDTALQDQLSVYTRRRKCGPLIPAPVKPKSQRMTSAEMKEWIRKVLLERAEARRKREEEAAK